MKKSDEAGHTEQDTGSYIFLHFFKIETVYETINSNHKVPSGEMKSSTHPTTQRRSILQQGHSRMQTEYVFLKNEWERACLM